MQAPKALLRDSNHLHMKAVPGNLPFTNILGDSRACSADNSEKLFLSFLSLSLFPSGCQASPAVFLLVISVGFYL